MSADFIEQIAVVTGGARGLGLSMARALGRQGAAVALFDVLGQVSDSAAELGRDLGVASGGFVVDVTSEQSVAEGFRQVKEQLGTPGLLINAAGIAIWSDSLDTDRATWQRVLDVNLTGTFLTCREFGRCCREAEQPGAIVNVSSMSAQVVNIPQHQASYHASKAGVDMLTERSPSRGRGWASGSTPSPRATSSPT
jgi:sorbose reductase